MRRNAVLALAGVATAVALAGTALGAPQGERVAYTVPAPNGNPYWLAVGANDTVWFTDDGGHHVATMDRDGNTIRTVDAGSGSRTFGITTTADGRVWFANGNGVGRLDADGGNYTYFPVSTSPTLQGMTTGPDGNAWFTEVAGGGIGKVDANGTITRFAVDTGFGYGLSSGPDGNVWFADLGRNGSGEYGRITPSGDVTRWTTASGPADIAADGSGNLWLVNEANANILKISASGQLLATYTAPAAGPRQIALGPDGAMWFTMYEGGRIGRIDANGAIQSWDASPPGGPSGLQPFDIAWGPQGDMWYTNLQGAAIGRIGTGLTTPPPAPGGGTGGGSAPVESPPASGGSVGCATPPAGPVGLSINGGEAYTNSPDVTLDVIWPICTADVQVANDGGFRSAQSRPVSASIPWRLSTSGSERLPKTVYLRFGAGTQNYTDDIILDQAPPRIVSATAEVAQGQAETAARSGAPTRRVLVSVAARDLGASGTAAIQVRAGRTSVTRPYGKTVSIRTPRDTVRVRVRDRAGNWSRVRVVPVR